MKRQVQVLMELLEPLLKTLDFELVDLEINTSTKHGRLRVYIDSPNGINVDDCAMASHHISGLLDVEDVISGQYDLEVSSPGLDRVLRTTDHFNRFAGEKVKVLMTRPIKGRRNFSGILQKVAGDDIVLNVGEQEVSLRMDDIDKARIVPDFG